MVGEGGKSRALALRAERDYEGFADDGDIADYAREAVEAFFSAGIINGYPGLESSSGQVEFKPQNVATRAEVAAIIKGLMEVVE